jgi:hypothetical protein
MEANVERCHRPPRTFSVRASAPGYAGVFTHGATLHAIVVKAYGDSSVLTLGEAQEPEVGGRGRQPHAGTGGDGDGSGGRGGPRSGLRGEAALGTVVAPPPESKDFVLRRLTTHPDGVRLEALLLAVTRGELVLPIQARYPLGQAAQAHHFAETGGVGKVLLTVS